MGMYEPTKVHVVVGDRERLKKKLSSSSSSGSLGIKINLKNVGGEDTLLLTHGQIKKMERAKLIGKSTITIPLSVKQLQVNKRHEGGFIGMLIAAISAIAAAAAAAAPEILTGVAAGVATGLIDKAVSGNGLYLYRRGQYARIRPVKGGGLYLTPHPPPPPPPSGNGIFLRHGEDIYTSEVISRSPWMKTEVPLLDIIL